MPGEPSTFGELAVLVGGERRGDPTVVVRDVTHDSRDAGPETLFVAIRGFTVDGHRFVPDLVGRAAAAVVEEFVDVELPQLRVPDTRSVLGVLAAAVHGHPSRHLAVVGVTGTNGKTTVTYLMESIVRAAGMVAGRIGTTGAEIAGEQVPLPRTTPEAGDLQRLLARMVDVGVQVAAIEVSSHALDLGRAEGVDFAVAAFTNLTQDHLDFHRDMDDYYRAKAKLFDGRARRAVIWVDDPYGRRLLGEVGEAAVRVGLSSGDVHARDLEMGLDGSQFILVTPRGEVPVMLSLAGAFNVANALVAAACALEIGIELEAIAAGIGQIPPVPGRMEPVTGGQPFLVLVDYAHSPGGVETVVDTTIDLAEGRVIVVVGAGGDRDREKRPLMGAAGARADHLIITSDNPRSEDPLTIIEEVAAGAAAGRATLEREPDRTRAIGRALDVAGPRDVVLILGKGHEQGQEFANETVPFDDRLVARQALAERGYAA